MAQSDSETGNDRPFHQKWHIWDKISDKLFILTRFNGKFYEYAPLVIYPIHLTFHEKVTEVQKFFLKHPNPSAISAIGDKLRFYRYQKGLLQKDIAASIGVDKETYMNYETGTRENYSLDKLQQIAALLEIDITCLLDDYHKFLYDGQGEQIKKLRKRRKLTQGKFAEETGVCKTTIKDWEHNKARISKETYKFLFPSGSSSTEAQNSENIL